MDLKNMQVFGFRVQCLEFRLSPHSLPIQSRANGSCNLNHHSLLHAKELA